MICAFVSLNKRSLTCPDLHSDGCRMYLLMHWLFTRCLSTVLSLLFAVMEILIQGKMESNRALWKERDSRADSRYVWWVLQIFLHYYCSFILILNSTLQNFIKAQILFVWILYLIFLKLEMAMWTTFCYVLLVKQFNFSKDLTTGEKSLSLI